MKKLFLLIILLPVLHFNALLAQTIHHPEKMELFNKKKP